MRWLASGEPIVVCMATDPEPEDAIRDVDRQCAIVRTNARGMEAANAFEMERWVLRIGLEELELFVGKEADLLWQLVIGSPEAGGCIMGQSFCERPTR